MQGSDEQNKKKKKKQQVFYGETVVYRGEKYQNEMAMKVMDLDQKNAIKHEKIRA